MSLMVLKTSWIDTPLGRMLVVADDKALYLMRFIDKSSAEKEIEKIKQKTGLPIVSGKTDPIKQIESELAGYFSGTSKTFKTPLFLIGSPFQKSVWQELQKIPSSETRSYAYIAQAIGKPSAYRAVALANNANPCPIAIPCHRVIYSNGTLGGYNGGVWRKQWLLQNETP